MITVKQLKDFLTTFKDTPIELPPGLDAETIKAIQDESRYSFSFFCRFIAGDENSVLSTSVVLEIRRYLGLRWKMLKTEAIAYTRFPFLPINQFCLKVAEGIAGPGEAVCQILMPGLIGLNRACFSLKSETEDNGHFEVENFIVNQNYTKLIPIQEVFETASLDSNHVLLDFQPEETTLSYEFGGQDFLNLANVAGDASRAFIQALKQNHIQRYDNNSLGFAIKKLATELKKASVSDAGSEEMVNNKVLGDAVESFYTLWKQLPAELSMPQEQGTAPDEICFVKDIKLETYGYDLPLESYFLTLFFHMQLAITEEEGRRVLAEDVFPCADQLSNILSEFLNQYPALYHILIQNNRDEPVEKLPSMADLLPAVLEVLCQRPPVFDGEGNLDSQFMQLLIESNCGVPARPEGLVFIAERIKSYSCLMRLKNTPALLSSVTPLIHDRLAAFPYESSLHSLFSFVPEAQQQVIIEAHVKKLIQEYNTLEKYNLLKSRLKSAPSNFLKQQYAEILAPDVHTVDDFCALTNKVDSSILDLIFEKLQNKYTALLGSYENTLKVLPLLTETGGQRKTIINFVSPHLYEWITPDNFYSFAAWVECSDLIANPIKDNIDSFDTWKNEYIRWQNCYPIQAILQEQLFTQFSTGVDNSTTLLGVVKETLRRERLTIITKYKALIDSKELFTQFAELIPEKDKERYLDLIPWERFIGSVSELTDLKTLFSWETIQKLIPFRLTAAQLNCTEEEFSALLPHYSPEEKALLDKFDCSYAIDELKGYLEQIGFGSFSLFVSFGSRLSEEKRKTAIQLIETMESERLTSLEKIKALQTALSELEHRFNSSRGRLEQIISGILKGKPSPAYSSNAAAMFWRYEHIPEHEERLNPLRNGN
ncbi:hypothetical protein Lqui_1389 [Legionella quinlivanii]|uniref:Uncharacterized protein n=1 Tax=Legionella quinlivanii TaxID=45073 RepID=A0A0W0Y015_9GAMM|nr:hypothetical protein [Legionella quinlivanii]KTD50064.1 hypothetical protein Lqui_1389 [Legionella quinlivanii]SEF92998.1 hypothetical protein SAMN02746093_01407 [Legionella quinlivanii DSM 21216]STY11160.1 Uncharacterised protein [Legionella quinlivanii]